MGNMIDGGEIIARMIKQEGIGHIFTLSGGHVQNIYEGCRARRRAPPCKRPLRARPLPRPQHSG